MADLTQEEWTKQLNEDPNGVVLDVRTPEEIEEGIIKNAMQIDIYTGQAFVDSLNDLDKSKNYYVYCRSGNRSGQACAIMNSLGFENTFNLQGVSWSGKVTLADPLPPSFLNLFFRLRSYISRCKKLCCTGSGNHSFFLSMCSPPQAVRQSR
ncbi:rhodanese-like domain-containing protein [Muriicola soli]|uniref:Rhodanese-like domain-containing protein n=1 Tax=Muriicola soli TaxID=2507538 RepID=A0A411E766_9FLAO|nr:rhodanese-like domain-containing protein [Muriicola soli]